MPLFDPTAKPAGPPALRLAPRPPDLRGLRLGLVDNRKFNAKTILEKIAERLAARHGTTVTVRDRKRSASHEIDEAAVRALAQGANLVISGVGD